MPDFTKYTNGQWDHKREWFKQSSLENELWEGRIEISMLKYDYDKVKGNKNEGTGSLKKYLFILIFSSLQRDN